MLHASKVSKNGTTLMIHNIIYSAHSKWVLLLSLNNNLLPIFRDIDVLCLLSRLFNVSEMSIVRQERMARDHELVINQGKDI